MGARFPHQTTADIFFEDYFNTPPPDTRHRLSNTCVAWGENVVYVEEEDGPGWSYFLFSEDEILVQDVGEAPEGPGPGILAALHPPGPDDYIVNGGHVKGHRILWNHKVCVAREDGGTMHYHQAEPRQGPEPPPIMVHPHVGSHYPFRILTLGSQVQNYRRIRM
ncbi:hypothetical protein SCLCIDRAFT_33419 [Scleroderma citrinum Foug A]|uniref:Uncharacterized protein n=1 Tax=Scleroderma citrinum Foug A TaxID=1036808 RepID=A0A0C3CS95_9AGAM|nr:hypothetical protein SCLCIDRAFT_33419 [Scleroderma citrinum Foug A]